MGLLVRDGHVALGMSLDDWRAGPLMALATSYGHIVPLTSEVSDAAPLSVFINHGKLSVLCPDCGGSEYAFRGRSIMMCASCWNGAVGFKWRRVSFPPDLPLIEVILSQRPMVQNQNWLPGETADDLQRDNEIHGVRP